MARGEQHELIAPQGEELVGLHNEPADPLTDDGGEGRINLAIAAHVEDTHLLPELVGGGLYIARAAIIWQKIKRPRNAGAELPKWRCGVPTRRHYSPSRRTHPRSPTVSPEHRVEFRAGSCVVTAPADASEFSSGGDRLSVAL
jgi:hypothetical protein